MTKTALSIAVLCLVVPGLVAQSRGEARIAALYREAAENAFAREDKANAIELLKKLLSFDQTDVSARLRLVYLLLDADQLDESITDHIQKIREHSGNPDTLADVDVVEALLHYRLRDFHGVLAAVGEMQALTYLDPRLVSLVIKSNHALGRRAVAFAQAEDALERFPTHPDILSAAIAVRGAFLGAEELAGMQEADRRRPQIAAPLSERRLLAAKDEAALLFDLAVAAASPRAAGVLARDYLDAGGTHAAAYVLQAEAAGRGPATDGDSVDFDALVAAFVEADGARNLHLIERIGRVVPPRLRRQAYGLLPRSGTLRSDRDLDGFAEEMYSFEEGRVRTVEVDPDQDGRGDRVVRFAPAAVPAEIYYDDMGLTVEYSDYPRVMALCYNDGLLEARYVLHPRRYALPLVELNTFAEGAPEAVLLGEVLPAPDYSLRMLAEMSYRIIDSTPGGLVSILQHTRGVPIRRLEDGNGDGVIDRVVAFVDGVPSTGMRDLDHDGRFESVLLFEDGLPAALLVDQDGDGNPEARERYTDAYLGEWDINEDGIIDVSEYRDAAGIVRREFANVISGPIDVETWGHLR